ncbi:MAG: TM1812 family CRISPR-associated protein [Treponema sp.]|jgi:hypothetical protein|nr:TM1812 family CRISPR-associated protein [Treponema sp.]MBQ5433702.1 TM1812 family CRISPR-associated protein [Treponema sp.]
MKKIIYFFVPMKKLSGKELLDYGGTGNVKSACHDKVLFGLNSALYSEITETDDVKVVLVRTLTDNKGKNEESLANIELFKEEFSRISKRQCDPVIIEASFSETKSDIEKLYRAMLGELEENVEIYADTTYGPRLNLLVIMNVLNFAERFFNAEIKMILNVKVLFDAKNIPIEGTQALYDVSPFYYLNNLTNVMEAPNGEKALEALDAFFKL